MPKTKKLLVCEGLIKSIQEKTVDTVLSSQLMVTIRNADFIPYNTRMMYLDSANEVTNNEKKSLESLIAIEKDLQCGYKPKRYMVTKISADEDYQRYMDIVDEYKNDPRVRGNR
jgi:hypothetical protein